MGPHRVERVFRSRCVVTSGTQAAAAVHVTDGRIVRIGAFDDVPSGAELVDIGELALLPGFVDSHVHINEPGRSDWEGFACATRAAAAGGITTLVDMPLNSIPSTITPAAFREKLAAADGHVAVDVAFWGGAVPGNVAHLRELSAAGIAGFKCFLAPSGVDEFQHITLAEAEQVMAVLTELELPLLVHAEDSEVLARAARETGSELRNGADYAEYEQTRPPEAELAAIRAVIVSAERTGALVHIVHISTAESLDEIDRGRERGVRISAETCPHYLWFCSQDVPHGGTQWKCAPPIRGAANRARLRQALRSGRIDLVASDHSPAPPEMKQLASGDFSTAWGGIASLQIAPLVTWSVAAQEGCSLVDLVRWTSAGPARLAGLEDRKGTIAAGMDADLVAFDPDGETRVAGAALHHRHSLTPYEGVTLRGGVHATWLRGRSVYDRGEFTTLTHGRPLLRGGS